MVPLGTLFFFHISFMFHKTSLQKLSVKSCYNNAVAPNQDLSDLQQGTCGAHRLVSDLLIIWAHLGLLRGMGLLQDCPMDLFQGSGS